MKLEITIDDTKLEEAIIARVAEEVIIRQPGLWYKDKKIKDIPLYELRHSIEKVFKENASLIEGYVREEVRNHVRNSEKVKNGKLHIAIEKALKEMEDEE